MNVYTDDVFFSFSLFVQFERFRSQQYAIGFKDFGIHLREVHKYSNGLLVFNEAKSPFTKEALTAIAKRNPVAKKVSKEIRVYSEEDHLNGVNNTIKELYQTSKSMILSLDNDVEIKTNKSYFPFRRKHNFAAKRVTKSLLKLTLNIKKSELNDPLNKAKDIGGPLHASGLTELHIKEPNEIQYVLPFIQQSYNRNLTW